MFAVRDIHLKNYESIIIDQITCDNKRNLFLFTQLSNTKGHLLFLYTE